MLVIEIYYIYKSYIFDASTVQQLMISPTKKASWGICSAAFFAIISQLWATLVVCLYVGGGLEEWSNSHLDPGIVTFKGGVP